MRIIKIDKFVELQAKVYGMTNFDLSTAIQQSKTSPEKPFEYVVQPLSSQETFTLFPIIALHQSQSKKVALLVLPDEKCFFISDNKNINSRSYYYNQDAEEPVEEAVKNISVGYWLLTQEETYNKGNYEVKAILCETLKDDVLTLMGELQKTNKSDFSSRLHFNYDDPVCYSLKGIKNKVRECSIKKIIDSLDKQIDAYKTWKALGDISFDMPSVETSRIKFKSDNHTYIFTYPCPYNPSQKASDEMKKPEEIEDPHYWLEAVRNDYPAYSNGKIEKSLKYLIEKKDWFEFSVDGKQLKVEIRDAKNGVQRIYVDGIPTRMEKVIPALMSLREKDKADIIYDLDKTHKLSPEMEEVLRKGLFGNIIDLEDRIQVNVQVVRHGNKYCLQLDGKEYHVEGGFQSVKKLQSILEGRAKRCGRWDKLDVQWSRDAMLFLDVLVEVLGEEKAIEFYQLIKKKDADTKLLDTKALRDFIDQHPSEISRTYVDREPCYKIRIQSGSREFYFFGFRGFELKADGKKYDIINLRTRNSQSGENYSDEANILYNFQIILDGKAEVSDYGF